MPLRQNRGAGLPVRLIMKKNIHILPVTLGLLILCVTLPGCLASKGVTFGHWARTAEKVNLVRVMTQADAPEFMPDQIILILPPIGRIPDDNRMTLYNNICREAGNYLPGRIVKLNEDERLREYLSADNIAGMSDSFNTHEIAKLGYLFSADHVIATYISEFRPYHPQIINIHMAVVQTEKNRAVVELTAFLDAGEQQVLLAMSDYLQSRRARKFDFQNLDIMLNSPAEYGSFAATLCLKAIASSSRTQTELKRSAKVSDN